MKTKQYWAGRFEALQAAQLAKADAYGAELERQYRIAAREIEKDISRWYTRLADNNEITLTEARQLLKANELKEFKWTVEEYIKYGQQNALDGRWMKQLENASAKVHISRLEALKMQMQQQVEVVKAGQEAGLTNLARNIYTDNFYHTAYEVQRGLGTGWNLAAINDNRLAKVIAKPWAADGVNFSERIWGDRTALVNTLHTELTQSIIQGKAPRELAKNIAHKFDVEGYQARRLVLTESAFFSSASRQDCFKELDVERYEILATLDLRTSDICRSLDGKVFRMADYEIGVTAPPFHPWCRSTTCPFYEDDITERAARDPKTNKTYYVPSTMKYGDWRKTSRISSDMKFMDWMKRFVGKPDIINASGFIPAESVKDVTKRVSKTAGVKDVKLGEMDLALANDYLRGVEQFYADYPVLKGHIERIDTNVSGSFARMKYQGEQIDGFWRISNTLSLGSATDYEDLLGMYESAVKARYFFEGTNAYTIAVHELTHALDRLVGGTRAGAIVKGKYVPFKADDFDGAIPGIASEIVTAAKIQLYGRRVGVEVQEGTRYLGAYAFSSNEEMLAQCLAYEYSGKTAEFSRKVKELFDQKVAEVLK